VTSEYLAAVETRRDDKRQESPDEADASADINLAA
jgi:hypothetical protein